ncbi:heavy metal translocating P-type ATPase [Flavimaricola sp.]|nr:heavy metal translocating P-type ATPase [Flavimaricola sp.]MDA9020094.1 heavy metal translocating P-type ATPase [Flavimaricola sp.]
MSLSEAPTGMACPGCIAAPASLSRAGKVAGQATHEVQLALPSVHCAGCISAVERGLLAMPGVSEARVNLTLKRVRIKHDGQQTVESLTTALGGLGYEALPLDMVALSGTANDAAGRDLLMRLGVAGFAMMNIMLLSVAVWSGAADATRDVFHLISGAIALPTVIFAGQPFFRNAWTALRSGRLAMDVPISLAILLATGLSLWETLHSGEHAYFDAAVMLTFFLLAGRYLDHRTRAVARSAAQELAALEVPRAIRLGADGEEIVDVSSLRLGDTVLLKPGGRVPVDGLILSGESEIDRSLLTGESLPVVVGPKAMLSAGEVNLTGPLLVEVTAAGKDTSLARMADLVAIAEESRSRYTSLADRAARAYAPAVHVFALAAFVAWMWQTGGDVRVAINIAAAVLIITCPCALGLAVPAVVTAASGRLFRRGVLIKSGTALERLAKVDTVVFDKTGTLTMGAPQLVDPMRHGAAALGVASALAAGSGHPLAKALVIVGRSFAKDLPHPTVSDIREVPGYGIEGQLGEMPVKLGRLAWVAPEFLAKEFFALSDTATWLRIGNEEPLPFTFSDALRPGAETLVQQLIEQGIDVHLLSGDTAAAVTDTAERIGILKWKADVDPMQKAAVIRSLKADGRHVLMVGDGLNDTAALTEADVSISPASALDAARVASDIVLMGKDLMAVSETLLIARISTRRIQENFALAGLYNIVAVPLAFMGLATPLLAALAMSLSSITVTLNALRLR